jgi:hypothetical protein
LAEIGGVSAYISNWVYTKNISIWVHNGKNLTNCVAFLAKFQASLAVSYRSLQISKFNLKLTGFKDLKILKILKMRISLTNSSCFWDLNP